MAVMRAETTTRDQSYVKIDRAELLAMADRLEITLERLKLERARAEIGRLEAELQLERLRRRRGLFGGLR